jgi:hypothetical protein
MSQRTTIPGTAHWRQQNSGIGVKRRVAFSHATRTSGAYVDGAAINRVDPDVALEAIPIVLATVTMASGESLTAVRRVQHRDPDGAWSDYGPDPADYAVTALDAGGAQTVDLATGWSIDLGGAKQEIRIMVQPTLTASGSDTIAFGGAVLLTGFGEIPPAGE